MCVIRRACHLLLPFDENLIHQKFTCIRDTYFRTWARERSNSAQIIARCFHSLIDNSSHHRPINRSYINYFDRECSFTQREGNDGADTWNRAGKLNLLESKRLRTICTRERVAALCAGRGKNARGFAFTHRLPGAIQSITSISFIWYFSEIDLARVKDFIQTSN